MECLLAKLYVIKRQPLPARGYSMCFIGLHQSGEFETIETTHYRTYAEANAAPPREAYPVAFHRESKGQCRMPSDKYVGVFVHAWIEWCPHCRRRGLAKEQAEREAAAQNGKASA